MNFIAGRNNLALTIYVPYDCPNDCPFCTSKKEYAEHKSNPEKIFQQIDDVFHNRTFPIKDVVVTGGEPSANPDLLLKIIDKIPRHINIYINTTLLTSTFEDFYNLIVERHYRIYGVNISRHTASYEEEAVMLHNIATDEMIAKLARITHVRINCVTPTKENYKAIIKRWEDINVEISFRADYRKIITKHDLHNPYDPFALELAQNYNFVTASGCNVCDTVVFKTKSDMIIRYHRGKERTLIVKRDEVEYNDIIISQNGVISLDWDKTEEVLAITEEALKFYKSPPVVIRSYGRYYEDYHGSCGGSGCGGGYRTQYSCGSSGC